MVIAMGTRAITYSRVSTTDQATSGLGLEAQRSTMATYCQHKGWATTAATDEGASGKTMNRPGLMAALEALDRGDADVLVVATLDRLSRSIVDFVAIQERAAKRGWSFVLLDLDVDTTTPTGEMMATVMAAVAQLERKLIGQRTSKAMQAKKARGDRLGQPVSMAGQIRTRIATERADGRTLQAIADGLMADNVPTARGGSAWRPSTIAAVLRSVALDAECQSVRMSA